MGGTIWTTSVVLALCVAVANSQYEGDQGWQSSRTRRPHQTSLFNNVQSSPPIPRRLEFERQTVRQTYSAPPTAQDEIEHQQIRQRSQGTRSRAYQQSFPAPLPETPQVAIESFSPPRSRFPSGGDSAVNNGFKSRRPESNDNNSQTEQRIPPTSFGQGGSFPGRKTDSSEANNSQSEHKTPPTNFGQSRQPIPNRKTVPSGPSRVRPSGPAYNTADEIVRKPTGFAPSARQNRFRVPTTASDENSDVFKTTRSRGRFMPRGSPFSSTTEAARASTEVVEREVIRRRPTGRERANQPNQQILVGPTSPERPSRFPQRTATTASLSSRERTPGRKTDSLEEMAAPSESPSTLTTEGYTAAQSAETKTRGRTSILPTTSPTPRSRQISRGEKKAKLTQDLKPRDEEISEDDNYPKEFLEKIKSSAETGVSSYKPKTAKKSFPSGRANRFSAQPTKQVIYDPDISESVNDEVVEQEIPDSFKSKETPNYTRHRYFGKSKSSTTTEASTTVKVTFRPNQTSNLDLMRQRYKDKLKLSQEERQKKLELVRPRLNLNKKEISAVDTEPTAFEDKGNKSAPTFSSRSTTSSPLFQTTSRFSRHSKNKFEPKARQGANNNEGQSGARYMPRFSLTSRQPDLAIEPATPTVAENSRSRNRYSRLRKEELSVEAPEAKTSWTKNLDNSHRDESTYNFIHLRTKDLTPLASQDAIESSLSNEVDGISTESSSQEATTTSTMRIDTNPTTESTSSMTESTSTESTKLDAEVTTASSAEITTEATTTEATKQETVTVTTVGAEITTEKIESSQPSQQSFPSTRHRFSSRYNGSVSSTAVPDNIISGLLLEERVSSTSTGLPSSSLSTQSTISLPSSTVSTTTVTAKTLPNPTPAVKPTTKNKSPQNVKTTTPITSFLDNRPLLRSLVNLFTTTTSKPVVLPKTTVKPKPRTTSKPKAKPTTKKPTTPKPTTTSTTAATTTTSAVIAEIVNNTISPLPLNAEEFINTTNEIVSKHTFPEANEFNKVPREELDALTPLSVLNVTNSPQDTLMIQAEEPTTSSTTSLAPASSTTMPPTTRNITSQPIYFDHTPSTRAASTVASTTVSTTTAADYFVYGIYPNNTVVRKRAWKTFDYEKYMSPYVIYGIYPNNTIVRKFPNGTIINDEFMTSDNEIGGSPVSTSTTTTTTTIVPVTSSTDSFSIQPSTTTEEAVTTETVTEESVTESSTENATEGTTEGTTETVTESTSQSTDTTESFADLINEIFPPSTEAKPREADEVLIDDGFLGRSAQIDTSRTSTPAPTPGPEESTTDPSVNQVLPLTLEEVQSLWSGNFTETSAVVSSSSSPNDINFPWNENRMSKERERPRSITKIAYRALSSRAENTAATAEVPTTTSREVTTEEVTPAMVTTTRKPRVKFVTVTPGLMTTTTSDEEEDSVTTSSQHVQRLAKASTPTPEELFTNVFGSIEDESPLPDILKDNEVEGDGLTAALARRIIALAVERAKTTTTESATTTTMIPTTEMTTTPVPTTMVPTTVKVPKKKPAGRAIAPSAAQNDALENVLHQLLEAQKLEQALAKQVNAQNPTAETTVKPPAEMEKTVENQIRLAEEVRKASRNMSKKKKKKPKTTTTTPAPRPILGFLFNFFNQPSSPNVEAPPRAPTRRPTSDPLVPDSQVVVLTDLDAPAPSSDDEDAGSSNDVQGNRQTRGRLITAAIDVTRAVGRLMGTVMSSAAQSFQRFVRSNNWGR